MFLPGASEDAYMSWNRARAFRPLLADGGGDAPAGKPAKKGAKAPPAAAGNDFVSLVADILPGKWDIRSPTGENKVTLSSDKGDLLRFPVSRALMSIKVDEKSQAEWDLSFGADSNKVMELIAAHAQDQGIGHTGNLDCAPGGAKPVTIDINAIHSRMHGTAPSFSSMDGFHAWRTEWSSRLFQEVLIEADPKLTFSKAEVIWDSLNGTAKGSWMNWLRSHPGMRRLELGITGFFSNGGATAFPAVSV
jgi:hypothetical protein